MKGALLIIVELCGNCGGFGRVVLMGYAFHAVLRSFVLGGTIDDEVGDRLVGEVVGEGIRPPSVDASIDGRVRLAKNCMTVAISGVVLIKGSKCPSTDAVAHRRIYPPMGGIGLSMDGICPPEACNSSVEARFPKYSRSAGISIADHRLQGN